MYAIADDQQGPVRHTRVSNNDVEHLQRSVNQEDEPQTTTEQDATHERPYMHGHWATEKLGFPYSNSHKQANELQA